MGGGCSLPMSECLLGGGSAAHSISEVAVSAGPILSWSPVRRTELWREGVGVESSHQEISAPNELPGPNSEMLEPEQETSKPRTPRAQTDPRF